MVEKKCPVCLQTLDKCQKWPDVVTVGMCPKVSAEVLESAAVDFKDKCE